MEERCLKLPFMVITLTIFTPLLADIVCNNQQVSRKDEFDNSICCYYKWCEKDNTFLPCTQDGGTDSCKQCESGSIRPDRFSTEIFDELPCEIPECYCPKEAVAVPGNDCPKTGKKQCICNRSGQFYGDDYNNCKYAPTPCNLTGIELKNNGKCGKCEKGFIKTVPDTSLCVKQSLNAEDTVSASSTAVLHTQGTKDTSTNTKSNYELTATSGITTEIPHENETGMATGNIIGIGVGSSATAAAIVTLIYCLCYRYKCCHDDTDHENTDSRHLNGYSLVPAETSQGKLSTGRNPTFPENGASGHTLPLNAVNNEPNGRILNETDTVSTGLYIENENEPVSTKRRMCNHSLFLNSKHNDFASAKVNNRSNHGSGIFSTTENSLKRHDDQSDKSSNKSFHSESGRKTQDGVPLLDARKSKPIATVLPTIKSKEKASDNGLAEPLVEEGSARILPEFSRSFSVPGNLPDVTLLNPLLHDFPSMPSRGSDTNAVPMVRRPLSVPSLPSDVTSYLRADIIPRISYSSFTEVESRCNESEETGLKEDH